MFGKLIFLTAIAVTTAAFPFKCQYGEHLLLPHKTDCSKFFYCVFSAKSDVASSCAPGTVFSFEKQVCDHPKNVDCKILEPVPAKPIIELNDQGCPVDFNIHYLVSHESDCSKFYICSYGQRFESSCGSGLWLNFEAQVCDWPENVKCANQPANGQQESEEDQNKKDSNEIENKNQSHQNNPNSVEDENSCPLDWDPNVLIPDAEDCSKFYYCIYGRLSERVCPDGTLFDSQSQICDWADNVSCFNARCSGCNVAL